MHGYFTLLQLYTFRLREDFYREDPGADSPQPMFGQVAGTDRDIGENAIIYFHALGDSKSRENELMQVLYSAMNCNGWVARSSSVRLLFVVSLC